MEKLSGKIVEAKNYRQKYSRVQKAKNMWILMKKTRRAKTIELKNYDEKFVIKTILIPKIVVLIKIRVLVGEKPVSVLKRLCFRSQTVECVKIS